MKGNSVRKELKAARARAIDKAARELLNNPKADVTAHLRSIQTYTELLDARGASWRKIQAVAIGLLSAGVAAALWGCPVPRARVLLTVEADAVSFRLRAPHTLATHLLLDTTGVRIELLTEVEAAGLLPSLADEPLQWGDAWLEVHGGRTQLSRLELQDSAVVELELRGPDSHTLFVRDAPLRGTLLAAGGARVTVGDVTGDHAGATVGAVVPEPIDFRSAASAALPHRLPLEPKQQWSVRNLAVDSLNFSVEAGDGQGGVTFVSAIRNGTVRIPDVDREIELRPQDYLTLARLDGRLVEIAGGDVFKVTFEGRVGQIFTGPEGFRSNEKPSWLAYLYHQQTLALLWGALLSIFGILWSVRRTLFS